MDGPLEHAARSSEIGIIKERKRRCCIVVTPVLKRENRGVGGYLCGILSPAWNKSQWAPRGRQPGREKKRAAGVQVLHRLPEVEKIKKPN